MQVRPTLVLAAALPMLVAACARKPAPAAPATANVVTVIATDYAFSAPDTIPAGLTTLNLVNHGREVHEAVLVRFDSGKTLADGELTGLIANGTLHARVHATFPVTQIQQAVAAAGAGDRDGKVLVTGV